MAHLYMEYDALENIPWPGSQCVNQNILMHVKLENNCLKQK